MRSGLLRNRRRARDTGLTASIVYPRIDRINGGGLRSSSRRRLRDGCQAQAEQARWEIREERAIGRVGEAERTRKFQKTNGGFLGRLRRGKRDASKAGERRRIRSLCYYAARQKSRPKIIRANVRSILERRVRACARERRRRSSRGVTATALTIRADGIEARRQCARACTRERIVCGIDRERAKAFRGSSRRLSLRDADFAHTLRRRKRTARPADSSARVSSRPGSPERALRRSRICSKQDTRTPTREISSGYWLVVQVLRLLG